MDLKKKFGLAVMMGLGLIAVIVSVIKTVEFKNLATPDFTYDATNLVYWEENEAKVMHIERTPSDSSLINTQDIPNLALSNP